MFIELQWYACVLSFCDLWRALFDSIYFVCFHILGRFCLGIAWWRPLPCLLWFRYHPYGRRPKDAKGLCLFLFFLSCTHYPPERKREWKGLFWKTFSYSFYWMIKKLIMDIIHLVSSYSMIWENKRTGHDFTSFNKLELFPASNIEQRCSVRLCQLTGSAKR